MDDLRQQLLNYSRRENHLRFYGIPETEEEENTEAVLKAFEKEEMWKALKIFSSKEFTPLVKGSEHKNTQDNHSTLPLTIRKRVRPTSRSSSRRAD